MSPRYVEQPMKRNDTLRRLTEQALLGDDVDLTDPLQAICQRYHVEQLALFGSILRADFNAASDVDVWVSFKPEAKIGLITFSRLRNDLSELFQRPVDLVSKQGLKPLIKQELLASSQVVYSETNFTQQMRGLMH